LAQLCIVPGSVWHLYVDVVVLDCGGNLLDAVFFCTRAALTATCIPKTISENVEGRLDFELVDDVAMAVPLKGTESIPLCVTVTKIGKNFVVDATVDEEACSDAKVAVVVTKEGNVCTIQQSGESAIEQSLLIAMIRAGRDKALSLFQSV